MRGREAGATRRVALCISPRAADPRVILVSGKSAAARGPGDSVCKDGVILMIRRIAAATILLGLWCGAPARAAADERHYVLVFGAQDSFTKIKSKHTWATFVRVVGQGPDPAGYQLTAHTISLVPADMEVRVFAAKPEPSANLDLRGSLAYARSKGAETTVWGPIPIRPYVYARSLEVWNLVQSGAVEYRAIDTLRNSLISDCIHAVTAVDPRFGRGHYPLIRTGKSASRYIARQVVKRSDVEQRDPDVPEPDQLWVVAALGLYQAGVTVVPPSQISRNPVAFAIGIE